MTKEELLAELANKINIGEIKKEEVANRLNLTLPSDSATKDSRNFSLNKMLYVLGAVIVVIGIIIFVIQIWEDIGSFGRVSVTLGLGLLLTAIGSYLLKTRPEDKIGSVFHAIGGALIPGGAMIALDEFNIASTDSLWPFTITFGAIFMFYLLLNAVHKSAVLTFFTIANGTVFVYLLVESIIDTPFYTHEDLYAYLTMVIGASYLLLAHAFREGWNKPLASVLNFFGSIGFLGAAFTRVFDSVPWQMIYFLIVIGGIFLSVYLRSRAVLVASTIFLLAHVSYITGEYFADSMGWPISLVILGFLFIGLGYVSININKKYIAQ